MDPAISKLLEEIPEKPPRSKLEPHTDIIATLRRKRRTYREIAQFLQEHLAIMVAPSTIHDFVRVRRRRGKQIPSPPPVTGIRSPQPDVQQKIAALKRRTPTEQPEPAFTYEEDQPLKLRRKPASGEVD
jgi:hypothetical protein